MKTLLAPLLAAIVLLTTACGGYRYGAPRPGTATSSSQLTPAAPAKSSGVDGSSVATGVAIGVGVTVIAVVVAGVLLVNAVDDAIPESSGDWGEGYCGSGCH